MKKILFLLMILSPFKFVMGQSLENRVPAAVGFTLSLNLNTLSQKINFNDLSQYNFLKSSNTNNFKTSTLIKELFRLPDKASIDKKGKVFIFSEDHDSIHHLSYLIPITSSKAFEERIMELFRSAEISPKFKSEKKLKVYVYDHFFSIGIYKDYALLSTWNKSYYYANDYDEYNQGRYKVEREIDSIRTVQSGGVYEREEEAPAVEENYAPDEVEIQAVEEPIAEEEEVVADEIYDNLDTSVVYDDVVEAEEYVNDSYEEYYSYDNDSLMVQYNRKWEKIRADREKKYWENIDIKLNAYQKNIYNLKPQNSIIARKDVNELFKKTDDIIYWFNYDGYTSKVLDLVKDRNYYYYNQDTAEYNKKFRNTPKNTLAELLNNNTFYGLGNFDKGLMKMNFKGDFNALFGQYAQKCVGDSINPEFFKYIKSDNLIGLMGFSINAEEVANFYYEIFNRAMESVNDPNKYMMVAMELTDLFLNKETMYHTFKGDAVFAVTGIQTKLKEYNAYEYDTLTFESRTVEKTKTEYMPEFVTIMTIQNLENVKRLLKLIVRLDGLNQINENLYSFKSRMKDINGKFFIVIKDNLFFVTNDSNMANEQISIGLSSTPTLANSIPDYTRNTSFAYWNATNMFKQMSDGNDNSTEPDLLKKLGEKINGGHFVSKPMNGNTLEYELTIDMKNRENSSLLEFMNLFEMISGMKPFRF